MQKDKKQLKQEYKLGPRPMGVYLIRNTTNDKVFLGVAQDLGGIINSQRFQLRLGGHRNKALQADWNELGEQTFAFEILEELEPPADPTFDRKKELALMETMWLEELKPYGERGYNQPKLSIEEKLRRIARNRREFE